VKRLRIGLLILSFLALVITGCTTGTPEPTDPSSPTDPSDPSDVSDPSDPTDPSDPGAGEFSLSFNPATLSLAPGGSAQVTLTLERISGFEDAVTLALSGSVVGEANDPTKVSGSFTPNPADSGSSTLALSIGSDVAAGSYELSVTGVSGALTETAVLGLTVTGAQAVLLVDDDRSANNYEPANPNVTPSASDTIFQETLNTLGVGYNIYVVPSDESGPSPEQLSGYETVIWYTASQYGGAGNLGTVSSADEIVLKSFLDAGERQLLLFADSYIYGIDSSWTQSTNSFLTDYIGAIGGAADVLNNQAYVASGVAGTVTEGSSFNVAANTPISTYTDVVNPAPETDTLLTIPTNPDGEGIRDVTVISGNPDAGTASSSSVIYVGLPFENIVDVGSNSKATLMDTLLNY
jgi:hypothetical protein